MGIFTALFSGVNGINSNGNVISVIGDNIANVNTIGFKGNKAQFEDILAGNDTGLGSRVSVVNPEFSQGGFESTGSVTDMAIDGDGFFILENPTDGSTFYSRAGQFIVDKDGYLVNADNYRVQGYQVDSSNNITSSIGDIVISKVPVAPQDTTTISVVANLDSNEIDPAAFDEDDPTGTSNFSAGITVYDSLGNSHLVTIYFRKTSTANSWEWKALVDGGEITGGTAGENEIEAAGTLTFDTDGTLVSATTSSSDFDFLGATQSQAITFDFGSSTDSGGSGLDGVTQFGSNSSVSNINQDGYASGSLKTFEISADGTITGNYSNGVTQTIAQVILASFNNPNELTRVGSNNYIETLDSGVPLISSPGTSGKGSIVSSTLEQSNVDLASELIRMVIIQRGFQANSRTISTVNDLLAQLVTLGQ
ncbi:flagellar hook protein FlgE [bacterium]|nr:flagellar hook protein FlgE [bacterium]